MATKSNKATRGRKEKYESIVKPRLAWINEQARNGISEKAIAEALGITEQTLNNYKNKYPELSEALSKNKGADVLQRLINSGIEAACGKWIEEETTIIQIDDEGKPLKRQKQIMKKYLPPNPALNQYYTKHFGKEEGFTGDPLALEMKRAQLDFAKAVQGNKDFEDYTKI